MTKLYADEIKNELIDKEMSFMELDNFMMACGYYSVFIDGATEQIKDSLNVVYTALDTIEPEVIIEFDIIEDNKTNGDFNLKVTNVEEF